VRRPAGARVGRIKNATVSGAASPTRGQGRRILRLGMAHPDTGCSCAGDRPTTARRGRQHRFGRTDPDFGHPHQIPSTSVSTNPISLFRVSGPRRCIISEICQKRLLFLELILKSVAGVHRYLLIFISWKCKIINILGVLVDPCTSVDPEC
jgi:hypothetical protein